MSRYEVLIERARSGEAILIDGATGSECMARGVPELENGWSGGAALSHPDLVRGIHADYIELGADLVVANTFATGRNIVEDTGAHADFETLNRRAVQLVLEARSEAGGAAEHIVVGAGISNWSFSGNRPSLEQLQMNTVEQATIMRDAGAEVLSLEMMVDLPRMKATLDAATSVGLPVWVGLTIGPEEGHDADLLGAEVELREGGLLADGVRLAAEYDAVDALCLMHSDVRLTERGVATIRELWNGPLGAYAHASAIINGEFVHHGVISPADYAAYVPAWRAAGATMIGGCCGIGPEHLRLVAEQLG